MSRTPISYSPKDYLRSFRLSNPDIDITPERFYNILNEGGIAIKEMLYADGIFKLANRLGHLMIRKFQQKGTGVGFAVTDKKASKEHKKPIFQFNDHSNGYIYRIIWNRQKCKMIADKNMWMFKPMRSLKRNLAPLIRNKVVDFPAGIEKI